MIVVLTGAGISADSGIATFRDSDGLWAKYRIEDVCTPEALRRNREKVIEFYNIRRKELLRTEPNAAHYALARLAAFEPTVIITQNIDDLHERAGSKAIIHLHGELRKLRGMNNELDTVPIEGWKQDLEARHHDGSLLRPYVVFFGEGVPYMDAAIEVAQKADIFIVVGTSLNVYPAASLLNYVPSGAPVYIIDPNAGTELKPYYLSDNQVTYIAKCAADGVPELVDQLITFH